MQISKILMTVSTFICVTAAKQRVGANGKPLDPQLGYLDLSNARSDPQFTQAQVSG